MSEGDEIPVRAGTAPSNHELRTSSIDLACFWRAILNQEYLEVLLSSGIGSFKQNADFIFHPCCCRGLEEFFEQRDHQSEMAKQGGIVEMLEFI